MTVVWYRDYDVAVRCRATWLLTGEGKGGIAVGKRRLAGSLDRGVDNKNGIEATRAAAGQPPRTPEEETKRRCCYVSAVLGFNWADSSRVPSLIESGCLSCRREFQALIGGTRRFQSSTVHLLFSAGHTHHHLRFYKLPVARRIVSMKSSGRSNNAIASSAS